MRPPLIVQAADGGMRDALSLLDQSISFSDETVRAGAVRLITGAVSRESLANVVGSLHNGQASELLHSLIRFKGREGSKTFC